MAARGHHSVQRKINGKIKGKKITVISGRLPAGNVLIFLQTVAGAGYRKVRVM